MQEFRDALENLEQQGLARSPDDGRAWQSVQCAASRLGVAPIQASSNDYLGLARAGVSRETLLACAGTPAGAGASRLIHGTSPHHLELERDLADWVRLPSALLFTSGFAANVGVMGALGVLGGSIVSDRLNHASIIDGCRSSQLPVTIVPHLDLSAVASALSTERPKPTWVVTESYFSMDGDGPDLVALRHLCDRYGAHLVVDEAHALGVFGEEGQGRCHDAGIVPDILVGTLGKAVGVQGAFVAGPLELRAWLWNKARSFVFSTASAPVLAKISMDAVRRARSASSMRARLRQLCSRFRRAAEAVQLPISPASFGPIVPVCLGDNLRSVAAAQRLAARGVLVQAIRPPTVPPGSARLRITLTATMTDDEVDRLVVELAEACA